MTQVESQVFRSFDKRTQLMCLHDLCVEIENNWSQLDVRQNTLLVLSAYLSTLANDTDQQLKHLGRLASAVKIDLTLKQFLAISTPLARLVIESDRFIHVLTQDRTEPAASLCPVTVVLDNIRSAHNVGSILRSCDALGINDLILAGYTATPEVAKVKKTAMGADGFVQWRWQKSINEAIADLQTKGIKVFALETTHDATSLNNFTPIFPLAIIVGNEHFGIDTNILSRCDGIISIPTFGRKNSYNVSNAFAICGYELRRHYDHYRSTE